MSPDWDKFMRAALDWAKAAEEYSKAKTRDDQERIARRIERCEQAALVEYRAILEDTKCGR